MRLRFSQTGNSKLLLQEFEARCRRLKESSAGGESSSATGRAKGWAKGAENDVPFRVSLCLSRA
eukprot:COSAG06_NODE_70587_length_191_cov_26.456522_1_plen_63_part_11